jgi:hypothetical protein
MLSPNGGEKWSAGSEQIIRWETNTQDSVKLDLLYGQQIVNTIDTTFGYPSAYRWLIPTNLTPDTSYKIIITSIKDSSLIDTSNASFTLIPPSDVKTESEVLPEEYSLSQNYPNPFNPGTIISYQIPESGFVSLVVFDVLGNEVAMLVNENKQPGSYEVTFDAVNLPSGVYFYTLKSNKFVNTKKMLLIK